MFGGDYNGGMGGLFNHLAGFPGGGAGRGAPARTYNEYFKAYSMAMLNNGRERANVSYGGKIILPPSALAQLTSLEIESPWLFSLKNPTNPAASTHAGVLEFIAEEGVAHLPYWMMKTLRLNEGDPIRIAGTTLPKGQRVKLQPQTVDFLELADPKAVLEQALRNFSTLTQGDIVEINHNMITFPILIMEITPPGPGIAIVDTDLEVDFAAPKGYVEPVRPTPAPAPTMASRLKIDLNASTPGSSRPGSSLGGGAPAGADGWEHFKGRGETLGGRRTKGKGVSVKKAEAVAAESKINRTDRARVVHTDDLTTPDSAPAPLRLPFGQLFFGYNYVPYTPPAQAQTQSPTQSPGFSGQGATLSGRPPTGQGDKGKGKSTDSSTASSSSTPTPAQHSWGQGGKTLSGKSASTAALAPKPPNRSNTSSAAPPKREKSPEIDWDYYDDSMDQDDDVIEIDSD